RGSAHVLVRERNLGAPGGVLPDLTLVFDLAPEAGLRRMRGRRLDRFEREKLGFHRRVRRGYLEIVRAEPKRVRVIRAARPADLVAADVARVVGEFLRGA